MALKILIVHESTVLKNILQEYILTDHPDAEIDFSVSLEEDTEILNTKAYDMILSGLEMKGINGLDVRNLLQYSAANSKAPLIIMTATDTLLERKRLKQQGIEHILPIPCTSTRFRALIYKIFNPDANTVHRLYAIPDSRVIIHAADGKKIPAEIINISTDSITCELEWSGEAGQLEKAGKAVVVFPADYGKASTISISGDMNGIKSREPAEELSDYRMLKITWKIKWNMFELQAATKKPLKLHLGRRPSIPSGLAENFEKISCQNELLKKINGNFESKIETLGAENRELLNQISHLRKRVLELERAGQYMGRKDISVSSLMNELARPAENPSKLSIFKKIIEDNVKLREDSKAG